MVDEVIWTVEPIPDADHIFMRAHRIHFRNGELQPGVFRQQGNGMSVDWEKYATPQETRTRAAKPLENAVIAARAGRVRQTGDLRVLHDPDPEHLNRAHSNVLGLPVHGSPELVEVRIKLLRISSVVLPLGSMDPKPL